MRKSQFLDLPTVLKETTNLYEDSSLESFKTEAIIQ